MFSNLISKNVNLPGFVFLWLTSAGVQLILRVWYFVVSVVEVDICDKNCQNLAGCRCFSRQERFCSQLPNRLSFKSFIHIAEELYMKYLMVS